MLEVSTSCNASNLREDGADPVVRLVAAGENPDDVYAPRPTFPFERAREKIFADDMTVSKLSELMGGKKRERIVNWTYVARTEGN